MNKYIVVISGATATGKSDFSELLAQRIGAEIINADIGSFYTPLSIGVAKPDWKSKTIPHHLFDILHEPEVYNAVEFRNQVTGLIEQIWQRGNVPIIVGGSAFYIKSLWYRQHEVANTLVEEQKIIASKIPTPILWQQLYEIDPVRADKIHPHDTYRLIKALAIYRTTKTLPSSHVPVFDPIAPTAFVVCSRDRQDLYNRINKRVEVMFDQGWVSEVQKLATTNWADFLRHKKIIGYDDILESLLRPNTVDQKELMEMIATKTRHYAKRQVTFLKKLQNDITIEQKRHHSIGFVDDFNLTLCDVGLYINALSHRILKEFG